MYMCNCLKNEVGLVSRAPLVRDHWCYPIPVCVTTTHYSIMWARKILKSVSVRGRLSIIIKWLKLDLISTKSTQWWHPNSAHINTRVVICPCRHKHWQHRCQAPIQLCIKIYRTNRQLFTYCSTNNTHNALCINRHSYSLYMCGTW